MGDSRCCTPPVANIRPNSAPTLPNFAVSAIVSIAALMKKNSSNYTYYYTNNRLRYHHAYLVSPLEMVATLDWGQPDKTPSFGSRLWQWQPQSPHRRARLRSCRRWHFCTRNSHLPSKFPRLSVYPSRYLRTPRYRYAALIWCCLSHWTNRTLT